MYIQMISIHGLVRGRDIEMGRDSDTGGQVRYVVDLARTLATMEGVTGVDLFTRQIRDKRVTADYAESIEEIGPGARIVRLPCGGGRYIRKERLWPFLDEFVDAMIGFTRREGRRPDLVHGHYADAGYVAREVAGSFGVPFVFTGHSLGRDKLNYLLSTGYTHAQAATEFALDHRISVEEGCLAAADLIVTSTRHERDEQYARYHNAKGARFQIIPPGIDLSRFFPYYDYELNPQSIDERNKQARVRMAHELKRFHFQPEKPLIMALCRPDKRKNINALIRAYGENKDLQALANLAVFAGIRDDMNDLDQDQQNVLTDILLQMDRYDLYGKMAIPKHHDSEVEVPELYRLCATRRGVFVNVAFVEPFGLTYLEASAVGLPFVGTKNGGPQDIVANCENGLLVDVEDLDAIASAIRSLLTQSDQWHSCSTNGINRVREHYSWENHCRSYLETVKEIIGQPGRSVIVGGLGDMSLASRLGSLNSLLITDIDNTLLGDDKALKALIATIHKHRETIGFGVATGRHLDKALEVLREHGVEVIDVVISSVGAEIYYGPNLVPDKGWATHLRQKWRRERVVEAMKPLDFLHPQDDAATQREFKVSYDLRAGVDPEEALPRVHEALAQARVSYNLIFSHGSYVDILPHRASKGKAVRYLSTKWDIPLRRIATAGDSGNDRDMLVGDTAGIVVGNYDKELEGLRQGNQRVYFAKGCNAAGILEGLRHYELLPSA